MAASGAAGDGAAGDEPIREVGAPAAASSKKLNVILDIDETFVQFVGRDDWNQLEASEKAKYVTTDTDPSKNGFFILRPYFTEFFTFLRDNCATVNLWTLSEREYAEDVKGIIERRIPGLVISNAWGSEDEAAANEADYWRPKDLRYIWEELGLFKPCDTILIDDLPRNTLNESNKRNGIRLPAFDPLGEKRERSQLTRTRLRTVTAVRVEKGGRMVTRYQHYADMSEDRGLLTVLSVLREVLPTLCTKGPKDPVFPSRPVGGRKTRRGKKVRKARKTKTRR